MNNKKFIFIAKSTITGTSKKKATLGGNLVSFERINNDVYGNPLYRIYPVSFSFKRLNSVYRNYESKGYYLVQSYYIEHTLYEILSELDEKMPVPELWVNFEENFGSGYRKLEVKF